MEENREYEVYKVTEDTVHSWLDEIMLNRRLLNTVTRAQRGPIMELRFIFRDGEVERERTNFKNVEQWTSVPCKSPKGE
jgi:hypothetical protein